MNKSYQEPSATDQPLPITHATEVMERLEAVYGKAQWRPTHRPLDELIATILSQNTSDTNTERAFRSLRERFPEWKQVRDADTSDVAESIRAGGLSNQKAPRIQRVLAEILTDEPIDQNARFLDELRRLGLDKARQRLVALPGVGPKTASCVLLFAAGMPALPVDTHVHRVAQRLGLIHPATSAEQAHEELQASIPPSASYQFHVHMIKHGREICRARVPRCESCFLHDVCRYYQRIVECTCAG